MLSYYGPFVVCSSIVARHRLGRDRDSESLHGFYFMGSSQCLLSILKWSDSVPCGIVRLAIVGDGLR
jgi:hypothetical protein